MTASSHHYRDAFQQIEDPIFRAKSQVRVLQILMEDLEADLATGLPTDGSIVPPAMSFMIEELAASLTAVCSQYLALNNAGPDVWKPSMPADSAPSILEGMSEPRSTAR